MDDALLDRVDEFADEHGYTGRSEVIREAARALLGEFDDRRLDGRELTGTVTALFEYDSPAVERRMMDLRREYESLVVSNAHHCVGDERGCVETFVVEGDLSQISAFVGALRSTAETMTVDYALNPIDGIVDPLASER